MLKIDPELQPIFEALAASASALPAVERGDWKRHRQSMDAGVSAITAMLPTIDNIQVQEFHVEVEGGVMIPMRWYRRKGSTSKSAVLYAHGGGKIGGSLDTHDSVCKIYADGADVGVLSVGFRLSPEHPYPAPVEDCYAGLVWLAEHADELGVELSRIGVAGDSGGGGIAAGVVLMARDKKGPAVAQQFLIYPMLDDRNLQVDPQIAPFATWTYDDNYTGWHCFLGDDIATDAVSPYAAPSRETNFAGLPPTFIDVGDLDIFRDESILYATQIMQAGVPVELHVYPGAPHGYDVIGFNTDIARTTWGARIRAMKNLNV